MAAYALFPLLLKFLDPCELKKSGFFCGFDAIEMIPDTRNECKR